MSNISFKGYKINREEGRINVRILINGIELSDNVQIKVTIYQNSYYSDQSSLKASFNFEEEGGGEYDLDLPFDITRNQPGSRVYSRYGIHFRMVVWVFIDYGNDGTYDFVKKKAYDLYS